jgi:transposase InsO family protein
MWHIDTTVIRLLDGTRACVHAVIDNFSRRILAWRVADTFAPVNSVAVLLEASRGATRSASAPLVLADAGVENLNAEVDELIHAGRDARSSRKSMAAGRSRSARRPGRVVRDRGSNAAAKSILNGLHHKYGLSSLAA